MLNVTIASELMKNYQPAAPVSGDNAIATAMDKNGQLLFFSIGTDKRIYMFTKADGSATGWERSDLSAAGRRCVATAVSTMPKRPDQCRRPVSVLWDSSGASTWRMCHFLRLLSKAI